MRILVGSPIQQKPDILRLFLSSLYLLDTKGLEVDYYFYDDHNAPESFALLQDFKPLGKVKIDRFEDVGFLYHCDEKTHYWKRENIEHVAWMKDEIIEYAVKEGYEGLFLVDSDLVLYPQTLKHLVETIGNANIVSEVFWTRWQKGDRFLPNVWLQDQYSFYQSHSNQLEGEELEAAKTQSELFLKELRIPGVYPVGGLGACTLIKRDALKAGVQFRKLYNLSWLGEDRHFCLRAAALGFALWADTYYPPYHIYRDSEIPGAKKFLDLIQKRITKDIGNKLTLMMLVRNEEHRYLKQVLESAKNYCDEFVILDDASTDNTVEFCKEILEGKPLFIHSNPTPQFGNEITLRKQLWEMAVKTNPDWLLCLDADEILEEKAQFKIDTLINQPTYDWYGFRLFDMWDEDHYRDDQYWNAHNRYWITLIRYQPNFEYRWHETGQHCGRLPFNVDELSGRGDGLRIKHLGWMKEEDRKAKLERYKKDDPGFLMGNAGQYKSILDPHPQLKEWVE